MARRSNPAVRIAQETAHNAVFDADGKPKPGVHNMLLKAVEIQRPLVVAYIRRLQRKHPRATAAQLADILERDYLRAVTGGGALVGATAVVPGVGTVASLGLSAAATVGFLEATALYSTSLAELHGIRLTNPEKASTMVMAIMLGEEGTALIGTLSGQAAGREMNANNAWGNVLSKSMVPGFTPGSSRRRFSILPSISHAAMGRQPCTCATLPPLVNSASSVTLHGATVRAPRWRSKPTRPGTRRNRVGSPSQRFSPRQPSLYRTIHHRAPHSGGIHCCWRRWNTATW